MGGERIVRRKKRERVVKEAMTGKKTSRASEDANGMEKKSVWYCVEDSLVVEGCRGREGFVEL